MSVKSPGAASYLPRGRY